MVCLHGLLTAFRTLIALFSSLLSFWSRVVDAPAPINRFVVGFLSMDAIFTSFCLICDCLGREVQNFYVLEPLRCL